MHKNITINNAQVYHSYQDDEKKRPALILIEEIWGLNDHIKNVADRFANEGYSVFAPELLPAGVLEALTPELQRGLFDPKTRSEIQPKMRAATTPLAQPEYAKNTIATLKACVDHALADKKVNGKIAVVGFCFGGTYSFHLAGNDERILAAVPFYGQPPSPETLASIHCPVLAFYGDQDSGLMPTLPKLKEDMAAQSKKFEAVVYQGAGHAFFNDTNTFAYRPEAAKDAWAKTLSFLQKSLG